MHLKLGAQGTVHTSTPTGRSRSRSWSARDSGVVASRPRVASSASLAVASRLSSTHRAQDSSTSGVHLAHPAVLKAETDGRDDGTGTASAYVSSQPSAPS